MINKNEETQRRTTIKASSPTSDLKIHATIYEEDPVFWISIYKEKSEPSSDWQQYTVKQRCTLTLEELHELYYMIGEFIVEMDKIVNETARLD